MTSPTRSPNGPFDYFDVRGDAVRASVEDPKKHASVIGEIAVELGLDGQRAEGATEGSIQIGVVANPAAARTAAENLARAGTYGIGCVEEFAERIDGFDRTVQGINARYETELTRAMSAARTAAKNDDDPDTTAGTIDKASIRRSTLRGFQSEYDRAEDQLETDA